MNAPKSRGIIFTTESVRAILDGRKTQTRRVMRSQPTIENLPVGRSYIPIMRWNGKYWGSATKDNRDGIAQIAVAKHCPYGKVGDRLWVRETFVIESNFNLDAEDKYPPPFSDGRPVKRVDCEEYGKYWQQCHYRATDPMPLLVNTNTDEECKWHPSIYMPRWASRINLEIVSVRVERVAEISEADAIAEGLTIPEHERGTVRLPHASARVAKTSYTTKYKILWDRLNAKRGFAWDTNPYVWVIEFRRI